MVQFASGGGGSGKTGKKLGKTRGGGAGCISHHIAAARVRGIAPWLPHLPRSDRHRPRSYIADQRIDNSGGSFADKNFGQRNHRVGGAAVTRVKAAVDEDANKARHQRSDSVKRGGALLGSILKQ